MAALILAAAFANLLPLPAPSLVGSGSPGTGPSSAHLLGTDELGRDVLVRLLVGARVSLEVGFGAAAIGLAGGIVLGLIAGYFRGWVDAILAIFIDTLLAFPALVFALAVVAFVGPSEPVVILTLGIFGVAPAARVVRSATVGASKPDHVLAARLLGARSRRVILREIAPFVVVPTAAYVLIAVAFAIVTEAGLSFFGVDVRPPAPSWGNMINEGLGVLQEYPLLVLWPSLMLFLTVIALNYVGDHLQTRFDIREGRL